MLRDSTGAEENLRSPIWISAVISLQSGDALVFHYHTAVAPGLLSIRVMVHISLASLQIENILQLNQANYPFPER